MICRMLNKNVFLSMLPERLPDSHKGDYGKNLLLCGSVGYTGAAALAAMAALRTGAGLVYLGVPRSIYEIEAVKLLEPIVFPLPDENGQLACCAEDEILDCLHGKSAVLIGPGLGQSEGSFCAVKTVLENFSGPVVLDADGINVICAHKNLLRERTGTTILTPHSGEFARLYGDSDYDRVQASADFAAQYGVIVLLKGHQTVITDGNICYINPTGNPGMATGGSGDVLAGILVSLLGQGLAPLEAAAAAAWLHGAAGDLCADQFGQYGMLPSDLIGCLPRLLK